MVLLALLALCGTTNPHQCWPAAGAQNLRGVYLCLTPPLVYHCNTYKDSRIRPHLICWCIHDDDVDDDADDDVDVDEDVDW